uniref:5-methyltetrahydropteroyltriglutamate-- homocysteine methyltransferase-like n=1 Tax=Saccoglossus kowalevskii TaxID=10224 RepID=A0ABM0MDR5_SACKO|nr:PREDICTED: 5-methyltetrahydropteroyltriglutamate--homocysteine methyltransferase-like [Saccoglossus kowalevskii]
MPLRTTVIGSYPKPEDLPIPDWFRTHHDQFVPSTYSEYCEKISADELEELLKKAIKDVIDEQTDLGIDVITDGEMRRENYIFFFCRHMRGFDFKNPAMKSLRNDAYKAYLPRIVGKIEPCNEDDWVAKEWRMSQDMSRVPVKYTVPGPMTIIGTTHRCRNIQIDEPVFARNPDIALKYGIDHATRCFDGVGKDVVKTVHLCCGYPTHLNEEKYLKADLQSYFRLASKLDEAGFDQISIEDAHRHNDLSLLKLFKKSQVVLGVVAVARSHVETTEEIRSRLSEALKYIPAERLLVAPDCGLGFLSKDILKKKLQNMVKAAKSLP